MNEGLNVSKKESHLKEGVTPIMTCIGSLREFPEEISTGLKLQEMKDVDWFKHKEGEGYVVSSVDSSSKFSREFFVCMGLLVAGITPEGKRLSFLTHQVPNILVRSDEVAEKFRLDIKTHLEEIKEKCVPGTIDAVLVGGEVNDVVSPKVEYEEAIKKLGQVVQETLGFEPVVINGPKNFGGSDEVYYDNDKRRLYFVREYGSNVNRNTQSFVPSDIERRKNREE